DGLLFSMDELRIGATLNPSGQAVGEARLIDNDGASIESQGAMWLTVKELRNTNADLRWEIKEGTASTSHLELFTAGGVLKDGEIGWNADKYDIVPANSQYGSSVYKQYYDEERAPYVPADMVVYGDESSSYYNVVAPSFIYSPSDPVWGRFGMEPPKSGPPS
ncbi:hypothetical protein ACQV5M_21330, partial [Leptospira sp. SA-E8]|uniref:hypothetical protein n=1 Tax=Leptospira sp. SA-E8 TaxID=3422259 RepID=UPI003EBDD913